MDALLAAETQEVGIKDQAQLWNIIYNFAEYSLVLRCAVEIGIADIIQNNDRILRYLVHLNILQQETCNGGVDKVYSLKPSWYVTLKRCRKKYDFMVPWHFINLENSGNTTAFEKAMGLDLWNYLEGKPDQSQLFNEGMAGETRLLTKTLIKDCRDMFQGLDSLVDIAFPGIKCTLYDLPRVIANSHEHLNIEKISGDMFEFVPSAQAILLKMILHDWNDEKCVKILEKCKVAIPKETGKVIIVDVALEEKSEHELTKTGLILGIDMLVNTGGIEREREVQIIREFR
ncbi:hypothetical protein MKW94_022915 [Papaver nudicaule]|uniref:O-methyltransferase C-terminal domain-containing protein n=1 Tax=Papaver nudicaule TaxID=74823 RepID=A0AA41RV23_PAPNU|nr:hypothetical protein [Papaver nudicaule]